MNYNTIENSYFLDTAGPDNGNGIPLDDPNMMIQSNFSGWDFVGEDVNGLNNHWRMCIDGVDLVDMESLAEAWLMTVDMMPETFNHACDANGDETINLFDFNALSENWGVQSPSNHDQ